MYIGCYFIDACNGNYSFLSMENATDHVPEKRRKDDVFVHAHAKYTQHYDSLMGSNPPTPQVGGIQPWANAEETSGMKHREINALVFPSAEATGSQRTLK